jgi:hypothetical protein
MTKNVRRRPIKPVTNEAEISLLGQPIPLYGGTGFPQGGQGNPGEGVGESHVPSKLFIYRQLRCFWPRGVRTRRLVWVKKCVLCTIDFGAAYVLNGTGAQELEPWDRLRI